MIDINIDDLEKVFNEYNNERIKDSLEKYIMEEAKSVHLDKLKLLISGKFNSKAEILLSDLIRQHFLKKSIYMNNIDKYDHIYRLILFFIGAFAILISYVLTYIISEIILIAGWVIIWEVIYDLLFTSIKRKRKKTLYEKLASCQIIFKSKENKDE